MGKSRVRDFFLRLYPFIFFYQSIVYSGSSPTAILSKNPPKARGNIEKY
jgi:hypothetical protein